MNLTNKLAPGTGVYCETREDAKAVVTYLKDCGVNNSHNLSGTDADQHYGIDINRTIRMNKSQFDIYIEFEDFERLIAETTEPVIINNYNLY